MLSPTDYNLDDQDASHLPFLPSPKRPLKKSLHDEDFDESDDSVITKKTDVAGVWGRLKYSERVRVFNEIERLPSVLASNKPEGLLELMVKHIGGMLRMGQAEEALRLIARIQEVEEFKGILEYPQPNDLKKEFFVLAGIAFY